MQTTHLATAFLPVSLHIIFGLIAFDADHTPCDGVFAGLVAHNLGIDSIRCRPHTMRGIFARRVAHNLRIDSIRCRPHMIRGIFAGLAAHNPRTCRFPAGFVDEAVRFP